MTKKLGMINKNNTQKKKEKTQQQRPGKKRHREREEVAGETGPVWSGAAVFLFSPSRGRESK